MNNTGRMIVDHTNTGAAFRRLSVPLAVQMLGDQVLGVVDTIAIGFISTAALAGVTASITVFFTAMMVVAGLWNGVGIIGAQRIGAGDIDGFARTVRAGIVVPTILGLALVVASFVWAAPLLHAMTAANVPWQQSAIYLILRCISLIPINISATLIVGLGAAGTRRLGVYILGIINLIHIPLLLILALGWLTHHPYGIVGAGISTLVSETLAALFAVIYVARKPIFGILRRAQDDTGRAIESWFDWELAWRCAWLGFPESIFGFALVAPDIIVVSLLAPLGASTVAAFRALLVVSDLTFVVPAPLQSATQTVIGQRLGARDVAGAQAFLTRALWTTTAVTALTGFVVALGAWPLAFLFTMNASVATLAALPLALHMVAMPIKGWAMVALAPIRAAGDTNFSMLVGVLCGVLVLPLCWLGIERWHLGLYSVPISWIIAWSARAAATALKLRDRSWSERAPIPVSQ